MAELDGGTPTARGDLVRPRRGKSNVWADTDPFLLEGEEGVEVDTGVRKRGPAVGGYWNDLPDLNGADVRAAAGLAIVLGGV